MPPDIGRAYPGDPYELAERIITEPELREDPFPIYEKIRLSMPVVKTSQGWLVTSWPAAIEAHRSAAMSIDIRRWATYRHYLTEEGTVGPAFESLAASILMMDPPTHTRVRKLLSSAFTARKMEEMRAPIQSMVDEILESSFRDTDFDLLGDLAYAVPARTICRLIGIPVEDHLLFEEWTRRVLPLAAMTVPDDRIKRTADEAALEQRAYLGNLIARRRQAPGDDLVSALIAAREGGERLSDEEIMAQLYALVGAGHETTANLTMNAMLAFIQNPEQWELLRSDPSLVPSAIEEVLRYDGPTAFTRRTAIGDTELDGNAVRAGDEVFICLSAVNRDPAIFADPDRFDIRRSLAPEARARQHMAFGHGIHYCIGAPLARVEAGCMLGSLARRVRRPVLVTPKINHKAALLVRSITEMHIATG